MAEPIWKKLPAEYTTVVGELALGATQLDGLLTDLAAAFTELDIFRTVAVFHHQQPANKVSTLLALAGMIFREDDGSEMKELEAISAPIRRAKVEMEYRNSLLLGYWSIDHAGVVYLVRFSARGKFERTRRPLALCEIRGHIGAISELLEELEVMRDHFQAQSKKPKSVDRS